MRALGGLLLALSCPACLSGELLDEIALADEEPAMGEAEVVPGDRSIRIRELKVQGVFDDDALLELELHLFEVGSNAFLGCSGAIQGMLGAVASERRFMLDAHFVPPSSVHNYPAPRDSWLTALDLSGKDVRLVVIESDESGCPSPPLVGRDWIIGESELLTGDGFAQMRTMQFGHVAQLTIGSPSAAAVGSQGYGD